MINLRFLPPYPTDFVIYREETVAGIARHLDAAMRFATGRDQSLEFEREPTNQHDANAIKIIGISCGRRDFLGYVWRDTAARIVERGFGSKVMPRLRHICLDERQELIIRYDIVGPKSEKKSFLA